MVTVDSGARRRPWRYAAAMILAKAMLAGVRLIGSQSDDLIRLTNLVVRPWQAVRALLRAGRTTRSLVLLMWLMMRWGGP